MVTDHNGPPMSLCIIVTHPHLTLLLFIAFNIGCHITCLLVSLLSSSWPGRAGLGFELCSVKDHACLLGCTWLISDTWIGESYLLLAVKFSRTRCLNPVCAGSPLLSTWSECPLKTVPWMASGNWRASLQATWLIFPSQMIVSRFQCQIPIP